MEYLLNGDIYIKRGPTRIYEKKDNEKEEERVLDHIISHISGQSGLDIIVPEEIQKGTMNELMYVLGEIEDLPDFCREQISDSTWKALKIYIDYVGNGGDINRRVGGSKKIRYDYRGCGDFWQLFVINNKIVMNRKSLLSDVNTNLIYNTKEEMDRDFIRLSDFLDSAYFIGRKFRRLAPAKIDGDTLDYSYMHLNYLKYILLYEKDGIFLVKETFGNEGVSEDFFLLDQRYVKDKKYGLYGSTLPYERYKDKGYTYRKIVKQIIKDNKEK